MKLFIAIIEDNEIQASFLCNIMKSCLKNSNITIEISLYKKNYFLDAFSKIALFDAIFLTIDLKNYNGIEAADKIRKLNPYVPIIFLSETNKYKSQGYEVWAIDYLLKPASLDDITACLTKIIELKMQNDQLFFFNNERIRRALSFNKILYFQNQSPYIMIYALNKKYLFYKKINILEHELSIQFIRCNRNIIVNVLYISKLCLKSDHKTVILIDGTIIPVSNKYANTIKEIFRDCKYLENQDL